MCIRDSVEVLEALKTEAAVLAGHAVDVYKRQVMTTIPFSLVGSVLLLWLADSKISMTSLLGFLMLIGTVVNNGILYVDTVNQYLSLIHI